MSASKNYLLLLRKALIRDENDELRAENERLRAANTAILNFVPKGKERDAAYDASCAAMKGEECPGCGELHISGHQDSCACDHCGAGAKSPQSSSLAVLTRGGEESAVAANEESP